MTLTLCIAIIDGLVALVHAHLKNIAMPLYFYERKNNPTRHNDYFETALLHQLRQHYAS